MLERYCYNTFVRVYMAQQRYDKAAQILMRLCSYANREKRPWLQMEGVDEAYWQEVLGKTRAMAEAYPLYLSTNAPAALPGAVQLSERALQVLRLQDRGLTRSEIARQLQLSERSVKYQCEQAYHKLGTSNKVEALAAARKLNLLN